MINLKVGDKAPEFLTDFTGIDKNNLKGKKIVLYFYPKDNTSGCTAEACNLRDNYNNLKEKGFEVIGVSPDTEKSHIKFKEKNNLPFELIPDTKKEILNEYGVWGEKKMYGKTYMGVNRTTFIINEEGIIEKIIKKVKTKDHTNQIYSELGINLV
ncbi:MAG: thioredoxin-dependent thiol peroxidase [Bacteroidetes bacterium 4572_117]|nr:MAG: thioredoxin-dependent thiol peroxidase [Bacteroidetes bacterium 4572_117]